MLYLISYDLRKPKQNYPQLSDALKQFDGIPVLDSAWIIKHPSEKARVVCDELESFIDDDDQLFVSEWGKNWDGIRLNSPRSTLLAL